MSVRASRDKKGMGVDLRGDEGRKAEDEGLSACPSHEPWGGPSQREGLREVEPGTALGLPRPQAWPPCSWFHGKITREQAERLLCPPETGLFLVRESTNYPGDYTLCVSCDGKVEHYRIMYHASKLSIAEEVYFENLMQLVEVSRAPGPAGFWLQPHRHWWGDLGQVPQPRRACLSPASVEPLSCARVDL